MFGINLTPEQQAVISRYVGRSWGGAIILAGIGYGLAQVLGSPKDTPGKLDTNSNSNSHPKPESQ
ncbi:hypothetical protein BJ085DRAFT_37637 [Dimargaris cristalligena]|uniref:Uncharacterized protein n=1 Tax=Dimargaris cristalligena TaxID=215637 RepID=A0A4P9ZXR1_9FUNG|nr:hypothetical protein BJ085DRAFT_37637 [Dimargaris cristalligena]|eukprot:RKP37530.1 hypothetical protein BJ085DRAFT_37637 [Dimargaris cristalligena]